MTTLSNAPCLTPIAHRLAKRHGSHMDDIPTGRKKEQRRQYMQALTFAPEPELMPYWATAQLQLKPCACVQAAVEPSCFIWLDRSTST